MEFLSEIFKDFAFPAKTLKQLDGIMTNVVKQLGDIKLGFSSSSETLDHLLNVYYLEEVEGTNYKVPKLRLFYLHIDQSSWTASVLKSKFEEFEFHMNYIDMTFDMTWQPEPDEVKHLQQMLSEWTNRDFEELQRKLAPNAVRC
jgi:disulfide oxidoreductase YuzD